MRDPFPYCLMSRIPTDAHFFLFFFFAHRFYPGIENKVYEIKYTLPAGLTCSQCVLQWKYMAGNNWGMCPNGTGAVGCGPQEEFRSCADIAITDLAGAADGTPFDEATTKKAEKEETATKAKEETTTDLDNEIPHEPADKPEAAQADAGGRLLLLVSVMGCTLLVVVTLFVLLYLYYYHAGEPLRRWWTKGGGCGLRDGGAYWAALKSSLRSCSRGGRADEKGQQKGAEAGQPKGQAPPLPPPRTKRHSIGFVGVPENLV